MFNKEDYGFILAPFVLTSFMIVVGYTILVQSTPEARINPPVDTELVEIITNGDIPFITPPPKPEDTITGPIVTIPQNETLLDSVIAKAVDNGDKVLYINIPVKMISDSQFEFSQLEGSNLENMKRWFKVTTNSAHEAGLRVILAMSISSSKTVEDPAMFSGAYLQYIQDWADIAQEYGVYNFITGITLGHPLFSELEPVDVSKIAGTIHKRISERYTRQAVGITICCSQDIEQNLGNYEILQVIPTPEYSFLDMKETVESLSEEYSIKEIYYVDLEHNQITNVMP